MKELQVENGNYTRITNPLIEELIKIPFKGCELAVALFIIRKTYGFQKKQDEISLTQFEKGLNRSRPAIVKALKNLQLVKVAKLVKAGDSRNSSNLWEINKYYDTWQLVKVAKLVKYKQLTSKGYDKKLVKVPLHTKETIQKKVQKKGEQDSQDIPEIIKLFEEVNPSIKKMYGNKTQRSAVKRLIETHGKEKVAGMIKYLPIINSDQYAKGKSITPLQLEDNLGLIIAHYKQKKNNQPKIIKV